MRLKRVALLSTMEGAPWGGSEELWAAAADEAIAAGHSVGLFVRRWPEPAPRVQALVARGAALHTRRRAVQGPAERALGRWVGRPVRVPVLPAFSTVPDLDAFAPDVVVVSEGTLCSLAAVPDVCMWLAKTATPYVTVCQHVAEDAVISPELRGRAAAVYLAAAPATFVARANLESAERLLAARLPRARVLCNPVQLRDDGPLPPRRAEPACFAVVARLDCRTKGQDVLFAALATPEWQRRDWTLRLYGVGPDAAYLHALAAAFGLAGRVEFKGQVADVRAIWAGHDLLVLPSRSEGTPLALLEAMLCGRPALVTDVGGNAEWVEEGATGWVADAPTPRSITAALERAWTARASWPEMGGRAHATVRARRDPRPGQTLLNLALAASEQC